MGISKEQFTNLLQVNGELCLTIYMPVVPNVRENIRRLKFLMTDASRQARRVERRASAELVAWTARLEELPEQVTWAVGNKTICVFARMGQVEYYFVPLVLLEEVNVGRHYKLGPLVALFDLPEPFYVLELRPDQPRLYRGGRQEFEELTMPKIQTTRIARPAELNRDRVDETPDRFPPAQLGKFVKQVAREAAALVKPAGSMVIPAGTDVLVETFREDLGGLNVADEIIRPKTGEGRAAQMYEQAIKIMDGLRDRRLDSLRAEYQALAAHEERASGVVVEVFQAAREGRVRELMFAYGTGVRESEVFREQLTTGLEEVDAGGVYDEIVEAAIRETLRNGGQVHALPQSRMPVAARVAAVYRY